MKHRKRPSRAVEWVKGAAILAACLAFAETCRHLFATPEHESGAAQAETARTSAPAATDAHVAAPSMAIIESACLDAAQSTLPDGGRLQSTLSIQASLVFPKRGGAHATWDSSWIDSSGVEKTFACSYDYEARVASVTFE